MEEKQHKRGVITPEIESMAITQQEVRLIPYVQYCAINRMKLNPDKMLLSEMNIVEKWIEKGFINAQCYDEPCRILTKEFWNTINDVLWLAYAN